MRSRRAPLTESVMLAVGLIALSFSGDDVIDEPIWAPERVR